MTTNGLYALCFDESGEEQKQSKMSQPKLLYMEPAIKKVKPALFCPFKDCYK